MRSLWPTQLSSPLRGSFCRTGMLFACLPYPRRRAAHGGPRPGRSVQDNSAIAAGRLQRRVIGRPELVRFSKASSHVSGQGWPHRPHAFDKLRQNKRRVQKNWSHFTYSLTNHFTNESKFALHEASWSKSAVIFKICYSTLRSFETPSLVLSQRTRRYC